MSPRRKSHYHKLKKKWLKNHQDLKKSLYDNHGESLRWLEASSKNLMAGSLASLLLLTQPAATSIMADTLVTQNNGDAAKEKPHKTREQLIKDLKELLPESVSPLSEEQKISIGQKLSEYFGVTAKHHLNDIHLNRVYGLIGAEQHLMRYPGDTMATHFQTPDEQRFSPSGMAPGRGAWGYFANSQAEMTQQDVEREKYYIAVQTFLAPGWNEDVNRYYNFFMYRKMLVVNPENGKAMVVVIGDAGPAEFTGKQLGGSPEVMSYLERVDGAAQGPVLYYFLDDPEDTLPLGPIDIQ